MKRFSVMLLLTVSACSSLGRAWCVSDGTCTGGQICVHEHAHDGNWDGCFFPCGADGLCPAGTTRMSCPDSPNGDACTRDDGRTKACFCQ